MVEEESFFPSLTQLRAFAEAARLDSITRAATELRRSQSAITQAVQQLEQELGTSLFTRTSTGSYLTDTGRLLHRRIASFLARIDAAVEDIPYHQTPDAARSSAVSRRITRSQIQSLIALREFGSFAQAARHAAVSLASLHRAARTLEQQLELRLLKNTAHGATTNDLGNKLADQFNLAVRELEWAKEEIGYLMGEHQGRLLVGALMLAGSNFIAGQLSQFVPRYPNVKVSLINGTYDVLLGRLRSGSIDFILGHLKDPAPLDDVVEERIGLDPYIVVAARNHPLAGQRVTLDDLRQQEWVASPNSARRRGVFEGMFGSTGLPRFSVETHSLPAIFVLLTTAPRLAVLTKSELALDRRLGNQLVALDFKIDHSPALIGLTVRRKWEPTPIQQIFLDFLRAPDEPTAAQLPQLERAGS